VIRTFILRLFPLCILLLGILSLLSYVSDKGLKGNADHEYGGWNDIYNARANSDLLIMGSSRATYHFSTPILDSTLGFSSYNLGMMGWEFRMQYARLKIYLQHNRKPRYIVESLDGITLCDRPDLGASAEQFIPYLSDTLIRNACKGYEGSYTFPDYYIPYYKYTHRLSDAFIGYKRFVSTYITKRPYLDCIKGYYPQDIGWDGSFDKFEQTTPLHSYAIRPDPKTVHDFEEFLGFCSLNGIRLIFVYSPEYYKVLPYYSNHDSIMGLYRQYADRYHIPFLDFSGHPLSQEKQYFFGSQHLNRGGAEIFSRILADTLKKIIPEYYANL
jgi:hypothetical protein